MLVYKLTNKINGKIYVGQTTQTLRQRIKNHRNNANSRSLLPIHCAIRKYGIDAFIVEEIAIAKTLEGLNALEIHYIELLDCIVPKGYNLNSGGFNHNQHPDTRAKISKAAKARMEKDGGAQFRAALALAREAIKGTEPWNKGRNATEMERKNLSEAHKGQAAWNKGKITPIDVKEKQKIAALSRSKPVYCLETGQSWGSLEEASKETGISTTHIKRLIKSGQSHKKTGLTFVFAYNKGNKGEMYVKN